MGREPWIGAMNKKVGPSSILCCLLLILSLGESGALKVVTLPVEVLVNQDVTIPCMIIQYNTPELDIQYLVVQWTHTSLDGNVKEVYEYKNGASKPNRTGSKIVESELRKGNAGLYIPGIQLSDEGEYKCNVFRSPENAAGTTNLQVFAPPTAVVNPSTLVIELGTEKSVMCEAYMFYPKSLKLRWVQYFKGSTSYITLEKNTCTGAAAENADGTYNVTSHLTLNPSLKDDGNIYSCIVEHRSMKERLLNFTLTVKEPEQKTEGIIGAVIGTSLIVTTIGIVASVIYHKLLKKVPPKLSEITGYDKMVHLNKATLSCQVTDFRPAPIKITLYIKRYNKHKEKICCWNSKDGEQTKAKSPCKTFSHKGEDCKMVIEPEKKRILDECSDDDIQIQLKMEPHIKPNNDGTFSCSCSINITPDIDLDNKAELFLYVEHAALKEPRYVKCTLYVNGVSPKLSTIVPPLLIIHEERVSLTCAINGFKPRPLRIYWLKKDLYDNETVLLDSESDEEIIQNSSYTHSQTENECEDKSFNLLSILTIKPSIREDDGATYICKTYHYATEKYEEQSLELAVLAHPELHPIWSSQNVLYVGEKIELSCKIHSFFPAQLTVAWYKDNEQLTCNDNESPKEAHGLYQINSRLSYVPEVKDIEKIFKCEVYHKSLEKPKSATWKLKNLISVPKINPIKCEPDVPECGQPVKLSCTVTGYYPNQCTIRLHRGLQSITADESESTQQDEDSGLFSRTIHWQLTPIATDHGKEFHVEVTHSNMLPETRTFLMTLKGYPVLKDITSETVPKYGEPLTLFCNVKGCNPKDIKAEWLENHIPVKRTMTVETCVTKEEGDKVVSYRLKLRPTAEHYRQRFSCLVKHKDIPEPIKKDIYLTLPEKTPVLSAIAVRPVNPEINKEVRFAVNISDFAPKGLQVKWFKAFTELSENINTSKAEIQANSLYSCSSELRYTPRESDHNMAIRCEVTHSINRKIQEKLYTLHLRGSSRDLPAKKQELQNQPNFRNTRKTPEISRINCMPMKPKMGEEVTLTCSIEGLDMGDGCFSWYNGSYPIDEDQILNSNKTDGSGCISTVKLISHKESIIKFELTFNYETMEEIYVLKLA